MGRHTTVDEALPVAEPKRMAWLGRTPLMPLLAGVVAVGVIAAAFSTRQISLNFAGGTPANPGSAACAGCESLADTQDGAEGGRTAEDSAQQPLAAPSKPSLPPQATRTVSQQPLRVEIKLDEMTPGGFTAVAVIRNASKTSKNWKLAFRIPNAVVVGVQGATFRTTREHGGTTWFTGLGPLEGRQAVKVAFTAEGAWSKPAVCKVNGRDCS
ncbi:hypothetical protein ABGB12_06195 [Actinocorallia sp. B10E7]|uniref:hypothetical protein n=1 Tax=Actinocorallia sp. B10E7 TaxID=3153558 RepID=UPI00325D72F4